MNSTSASLLLRLRKANDQLAWCRFVDLYTPLLFYWARRMGVSAEDASDLVQEVLAIVFQKLPEFKYDPQKSFRGWLRTITLNKYRQWCRRKSIGIVDATQSQIQNVKVAESTWDLHYQQALVASAMEVLQSEFQPATWAALKAFVGGQPAKDAASDAGVSVWTVYAAKSRLMVRLRQELKELLD